MTHWWQNFEPWAKVTTDEWSSWQWQLRNVSRSVERVADWCGTRKNDTANEIQAGFAIKVTPHMAAAALHYGADALRVFSRAYLPSLEELSRLETSNSDDGIGEELEHTNPVPAVSHFYPDRALFKIVKMCPAYCRYCFRRRMLGDGKGSFNPQEIAQGIDYIKANTNIREVILSGGDPLVLGDDRLASILDALSALPHVRRLRLDTKALFMVPGRFTAALIKGLKKFRAVYVMCHFSHPYELSPDVAAAAARLADAGIQLRAHTPLLRGINDSVPVLSELFEMLVDTRIQPYHMLHFIPTPWTEHFRVPFREATRIYELLQNSAAGLALPAFVVYLPNGNGKVIVAPNRVIDRPGRGVWLRSVRRKEVLYEEPEIWRSDAISA